MENETLNTIETTLRRALRSLPEHDDLKPEEIIELAELGRRHPKFGELLARVAQSPSALSLYRAAKCTIPQRGIQKAGKSWREGVLELPHWFEGLFASARLVPVPAYRSAPVEAPAACALLKPDPVNQSLLPGVQPWRVEGHSPEIVVSTEDRELEADASLMAGQVVTVTVCPATGSWSLHDQVTYRFKVLSAEDQKKARWAEEYAQEAPVASAMTSFMLGLFGKAESLLTKWPDDPELDVLAELIRKTCQARRADARQFYL